MKPISQREAELVSGGDDLPPEGFTFPDPLPPGMPVPRVPT